MISRTDRSIEVVKKLTYVYLIGSKALLLSAFPAVSYLTSRPSAILIRLIPRSRVYADLTHIHQYFGYGQWSLGEEEERNILRGKEEERSVVRGEEQKRNIVRGEEEERNIVRGEEEERNIVRGEEEERSVVGGEEEERNIVRGEEQERNIARM